MNRQLVLTIVARDKPGIVQAVSEVVAGHGGNWMDSSMVRLGGEFAGIVRVSIPDEEATRLGTALTALKDAGLVVTVQGASAGPPRAGATAHLTLSGADHPGIVRDISSALAEAGVSIEEFNSEQFAGSMTGQKMFHASARVVIPTGDRDGDGVDLLRQRLERLAQDLMVEIDIQAKA